MCFPLLSLLWLAANCGGLQRGGKYSAKTDRQRRIVGKVIMHTYRKSSKTLYCNARTFNTGKEIQFLQQLLVASARAIDVLTSSIPFRTGQVTGYSKKKINFIRHNIAPLVRTRRLNVVSLRGFVTSHHRPAKLTRPENVRPIAEC